MWKPRIYLAGKIAPHDWREQLIGSDIAITDADVLFDPQYIIERPTFIYGGPFYIACDHKCGHGRGNHGVGATGNACFSWPEENIQRRVFEVNRARLDLADAVLAFIDAADCYGTLIELGMAAEMGKFVHVTLGGNLTEEQVADLWMVRGCAAIWGRGTPAEMLSAIQAAAVTANCPSQGSVACH